RIGLAPPGNAPAEDEPNDQPPPRLSLHQLAEQMQQALAPNPALTEQIKITLHVYSEDKARRLVGIGNAIFHEGDWLDHDIRLIAITRHGIVVELGSERFGIPAW